MYLSIEINGDFLVILFTTCISLLLPTTRKIIKSDLNTDDLFIVAYSNLFLSP